MKKLVLSLSAFVSFFCLVDGARASDVVWDNVNTGLSLAWHSSMAVDASGIYVAGAVPAAGCGGGFASEVQKRSLTDGHVLWRHSINQTMGWCDKFFYGVAVDNAGVYAVAGDGQWIKLDLNDGHEIKRLYTIGGSDLIVAAEGSMYAAGGGNAIFGGSGVSRIDANGDSFWSAPLPEMAVTAIAADATGVYLGGVRWYGGGGSYRWMSEKRSPVDGILIWGPKESFLNGPLPASNAPTSIVADATGVYFVGTIYTALAKDAIAIEKRSIVTGALLWPYVSPDKMTHSSYGIEAALHDGSLYVAGGVENVSACIRDAQNGMVMASDGTILWREQLASSGRVVGLEKNGSFLYVLDRSGVLSKRTLDAPGTPPIAPTVTGPASGGINDVLSFTLFSTDPDGSPVRYGIDWDNNCTIDEWAPAVNLLTGAPNYVVSGTEQTVAHSWNSQGLKTFKVRAEDAKGGLYTWTSYSVTISAGTLQLCREGIALDTNPYDFSIAQGGTTSFTAHFDTTPGNCEDASNVTALATFTEANPAGGAISFSGSNPKTLTASLVAGSESATVSYSGQSVALNASVICSPLSCGSSSIRTQTAAFCPTESRTFDDGCGGTTAACPGTRYCDFNWKEVAPGR